MRRRLGLEVADKPDSQDICFVPNGHYSDVVAQLRPDAFEPGEIVHVDGRVLGSHTRAWRSSRSASGAASHVADGERLYVVAIEPATRRVVVGPKQASLAAVIELAQVNWLGATPPAGQSLPVLIKHRYNEPAAPARLRALDRRQRAWSPSTVPQAGIAPGQACVCYLGTRVARRRLDRTRHGGVAGRHSDGSAPGPSGRSADPGPVGAEVPGRDIFARLSMHYYLLLRSNAGPPQAAVGA